MFFGSLNFRFRIVPRMFKDFLDEILSNGRRLHGRDKLSKQAYGIFDRLVRFDDLVLRAT
jgi:hypothetical protein